MYGKQQVKERFEMNIKSSLLKKACLRMEMAAQDGFGWDSSLKALQKVKEEIDEIEQELKQPNSLSCKKALQEEIGDLFLACVCLAKYADVDPDQALSLALAKFDQRYIRIQDYVAAKGLSFQTMSSDEILCLWNQLKKTKL